MDLIELMHGYKFITKNVLNNEKRHDLAILDYQQAIQLEPCYG